MVLYPLNNGGEAQDEKDRKRMAKQAKTWANENYSGDISKINSPSLWDEGVRNAASNNDYSLYDQQEGQQARLRRAFPDLNTAGQSTIINRTQQPLLGRMSTTLGLGTGTFRDAANRRSASNQALAAKRGISEEERKRLLASLGPSAMTTAPSMGSFGVSKNMGGPISGNPHGYNEGGNVGATPIKKVMDEDKLESQQEMAVIKEDQAERSFEMAEARKDEAHKQAMMQKEEAHRAAMKLKRESATMKAPLSK